MNDFTLALTHHEVVHEKHRTWHYDDVNHFVGLSIEAMEL